MELCNSTVIRGSINAIDMAGTESVVAKVRVEKDTIGRSARARSQSILCAWQQALTSLWGRGASGGFTRGRDLVKCSTPVEHYKDTPEARGPAGRLLTWSR